MGALTDEPASGQASRLPDYQDVLFRLAEEDPRVVVMTAENRAAIRTLPERLGPRFVDVGIAEQTLVGMAAGLALRGRIPVVHALATFLTMRAFEFIRTDVGIPGLPVKLVGDVPGLLSEANGPTHQALEDLALMRGVPGMTVFSPADREDLVLGLPHVLAAEGPAYIRMNRLEPSFPHDRAFELGRAERVLPGRDVALLSHGALTGQAYRAAEILRARGVSARLLSMRTLAPLDEEAVVTAARETDALVTVEDHFQAGGLFTVVAELLVRRRLTVPVHSIAFPQRFFEPGLLPHVIRHEGLDALSLARRIEAFWRLDVRGEGAHGTRDRSPVTRGADESPSRPGSPEGRTDRSLTETA